MAGNTTLVHALGNAPREFHALGVRMKTAVRFELGPKPVLVVCVITFAFVHNRDGFQVRGRVIGNVLLANTFATVISLHNHNAGIALN